MGQDKRAQGEPASELHKLLGMTPAQVRQQLIDQGLNPEAEIAAMRRLGRVMAAKFAEQVEREAQMPAGLTRTYPKFQEAVAAGQPAWAEGSAPPEDVSLLDVLAKGSTEDKLWAAVSGWSMRDEGINDGDVVLVDTKQEPKDGDVVLAHLPGMGQVVKRLRKRRGKIWLESANPDFADIEVEDPATLVLHGVVVGRAGKV